MASKVGRLPSAPSPLGRARAPSGLGPTGECRAIAGAAMKRRGRAPNKRTPAEQAAYDLGYRHGYKAGRSHQPREYQGHCKKEFTHCWGCVAYSVCPFRAECSKWRTAPVGDSFFSAYA